MKDSVSHIVLAIFLCAILFVGFVPNQSDFWLIILPYTTAFAGYLYFIRQGNNYSLKHLLWAGILIRFVLIFSFPNLSDDIYRFLWDGHLTLHDISPFSHLPSEIIEQNICPSLSQEHFQLLNSPEYFSIYPPVCQLIFALAAMCGEQYFIGSILIKSIFLLAELGSLFFVTKILGHYRMPPKRILVYALNPLIIIEIMGNLHFEGIMIFFFTAFFWLFVSERIWSSAVFLSLSIATKLLPLIFLPFLMNKLGLWKAIKYYILVLAIVIVLFIPILIGVDWQNFLSSIDLYFRKFEFNASFYYLAREIGYIKTGYNQIAYIGPIVSLVSLALILLLWVKSLWPFKARNLANYFLISFCIYLFGTTTVHPWYLCLPILLSCFSELRFVILWSLLIFMSYINYSFSQYYEPLYLVGIQYLLVFSYLIFDIYILVNPNKSKAHINTNI